MKEDGTPARGAMVERPGSPSHRGFMDGEKCRFRPLKGEGVRVVIRLTCACDLACPHCLVEKRTRDEELSTVQWKALLRDLPSIGAKKVLLTGGEPLLRDDLAEIVEYISTMGIPVDLNSNLQRMTREKLWELHDAGLTEISVSLEGPERVHDRAHGAAGAFAQLLRAIGWAAGMGIPVDGSCCVTSDSLGSMDELLRLAGSLPFASFTFSRLLPAGHGRGAGNGVSPGELARLYDRLAGERALTFPVRLTGFHGPPGDGDCMRGKSLIGITPAGEVVGCVLTGDNPPEVPHPLESGLGGALEALRKGLGERDYRLCWSEPGEGGE